MSPNRAIRDAVPGTEAGVNRPVEPRSMQAAPDKVPGTPRPLLTGRESLMRETFGGVEREFSVPGNGKQISKLPPCHYCKRPAVLFVYNVPQCTQHLVASERKRLVEAIARGHVSWR